MKTKTAAKSKKPKVKVQDMRPKKDARGGAVSGERSRQTSLNGNLQIADLTSVAIDP